MHACRPCAVSKQPGPICVLSSVKVLHSRQSWDTVLCRDCHWGSQEAFRDGLWPFVSTCEISAMWCGWGKHISTLDNEANALRGYESCICQERCQGARAHRDINTSVIYICLTTCVNGPT